jgi:excisionase family DNA binding protein
MCFFKNEIYPCKVRGFEPIGFIFKIFYVIRMVDQVYTIKESAAILKVDRNTIDRMIRDGRLKCSLKSPFRITETAINEFLNGPGKKTVINSK